MNKNNIFSTKELKELSECLYYLNLAELKNLSNNLGIPYGKKGELIDRIIHYIKTGEITTAPVIPAKSKAQRNVIYPLEPNTLILYGSYKNDLVTRNFFKKIIGPHFHFTAFGVDWINDRWLASKPPTYKEFAEYWQQESDKRKKYAKNPKTEWAYINFIQRYMEQYPKASATEVRKAWHKERKSKVSMANTLLKKFKKLL